MTQCMSSNTLEYVAYLCMGDCIAKVRQVPNDVPLPSEVLARERLQQLTAWLIKWIMKGTIFALAFQSDMLLKLSLTLYEEFLLKRQGS